MSLYRRIGAMNAKRDQINQIFSSSARLRSLEGIFASSSSSPKMQVERDARGSIMPCATTTTTTSNDEKCFFFSLNTFCRRTNNDQKWDDESEEEKEDSSKRAQRRSSQQPVAAAQLFMHLLFIIIIIFFNFLLFYILPSEMHTRKHSFREILQLSDFASFSDFSAAASSGLDFH